LAHISAFLLPNFPPDMNLSKEAAHPSILTKDIARAEVRQDTKVLSLKLILMNPFLRKLISTYLGSMNAKKHDRGIERGKIMLLLKCHGKCIANLSGSGIRKHGIC